MPGIEPIGRQPIPRLILTGLLFFSLIPMVTSPVSSQRYQPRQDFARPQNKRNGPAHQGEFTFARLRYDSYGWGGWTTDYPKADEQFIYGLRGWVRSSLDISDHPVAVSMDEPNLFRHPFIYVVEPGQMELSREDAANLREYLLRSGFIMLDDFWGEYEWENVRQQLFKVFPEHQLKQIPLDHPIFHCYYDIEEALQVPNYHNYVYRGRTEEKGGRIPSYWGILDEQERIMVFVARNADNGDAWEWIDDPSYPLKYGLGAYKLGTNLIVYSMTH